MAEIRQSARVKALQEEDKAVLERAIQESLVGTLPKDDSKSDSKDQVKPDAPPLVWATLRANSDKHRESQQEPAG